MTDASAFGRLSKTWTVPPPSPITAAYLNADRQWVVTEPYRIEFRDIGLFFEFQWHHSGPTVLVEAIVLSIAGTHRDHRVTPSSLVHSDTFTFSYLMPY